MYILLCTTYRERKGLQTLLLEDEAPNEIAAFARDARQQLPNNSTNNNISSANLDLPPLTRRDRARSSGAIDSQRFKMTELRSRPLHRAPPPTPFVDNKPRKKQEEGEVTSTMTSSVISTVQPGRSSVRRKRTISVGGVLPTRSYRTEVVRSYKDDKSYQPETLSLLKTSSTAWFDVPYRTHSGGGISRASWSRASTAARYSTNVSRF